MAETNSAAAIPKFTYDQIVNSRKYAAHRDVLHAVLNIEKTYSHAEIEKAIEAFNKRDLSKGVKK